MIRRFFQKRERPSASGQQNTLAVSPDVRVSMRGDGIVFLHSGTGAVFSANATGARMWELLQRGEAPETIGDALAPEFGVAVDVVARDATRFAADLESQGILVRGRAA